MRPSIPHNEQWDDKANRLRQFVVMRERLPQANSKDEEERILHTFIATQRKAQSAGNLSRERTAVLNHINRGIKHAFESLDNLPNTSKNWWRALGYGNGDCIKNMMDAF